MLRWPKGTWTSEHVVYSPIRLRVGTVAVILTSPPRTRASYEIMLPDGATCVIRDIYMKNLTLL